MLLVVKLGMLHGMLLRVLLIYTMLVLRAWYQS